MRVLLDKCLPRRLGRELTGHEATTVPDAGWAGVSNGALLARIPGHYDVFVTVDKNLPAQQKLRGIGFGVVVLRAKSNRLADLRPLVPELIAALSRIDAGMVVHLGQAPRGA